MSDAVGALPIEPFDGQTVLDAYGVVWQYKADKDYWISNGKVNKIPVASLTSNGLFSKQQKAFLDTIPVKGGGYALFLKPLTAQRTTSNPDNLLHGKIKFISESLNLNCVDSDGDLIKGDQCRAFYETKDDPPGIDMNFTDAFLENFCVEIPSIPGPQGYPGDVGDQGIPGTGDGPQGATGDAGKDATNRYILSGVKIVESDDFYESVIVDASLDNGDLVLKRGTLNTQGTVSASKVVARRLLRDMIFGACFDYTLKNVPCSVSDPNTEYSELDVDNPTVLFFPSHYKPENAQNAPEIDGYQTTRAKLSDAVDELIAYYQNQLAIAETTYNKQINDFLSAKDSEARKLLDEMLQELFSLESKETPEFCIGINKSCDPTSNFYNENYTPYNGIKDDPSIVDLLGTSGSANTRVDLLYTEEITADQAPRFSYVPTDPFTMPGSVAGGIITPTSCGNVTDNGCWLQFDNGVLSFVANGTYIPEGTVIYTGKYQCGKLPPKIRTSTNPDPHNATTQAIIAQLMAEVPPNVIETLKVENGFSSSHVIADWYQQWSGNLKTSLQNANIVYQQKKLHFSQTSTEFPAGIYLFVYEGGGFTQPRLTRGELHGLDTQDSVLVNGAFQNYWVGNEVSVGTNPERDVFILNPYDRSMVDVFQSRICSTGVGLEIGWVPTNYDGGLASNYFSLPTSYIAKVAADTTQFQVPLAYHDPYNLNYTSGIDWHEFPVAGSGTDDIYELQKTYMDGAWSGRMLIFQTAQPGFFFSRVKTAVSFLNLFGSFIQPEVEILDGNSYSKNRAIIYDYDRWSPPVLNARPDAVGSIKLNIARVVTT